MVVKIPVKKILGKKIEKEIEKNNEKIQEFNKKINENIIEVKQEVKPPITELKVQENSKLELTKQESSLKDLLLSLSKNNDKSNNENQQKEQNDLKNRLKSFVKSLLDYRAFVIYFYDLTNLNSEIIPLMEIKPILKIKRFSEQFLLINPSFFISGKPVFVLLRNVPYSIKLSMNVESKELIGTGYSSSEIEAIANSHFIQRLFRQKGLSKVQYFTMMLMVLCSDLIVYIFCYTIFNK